MTAIKFTIPGEPHALKRHRHGKGRTYDPKENSDAKQQIGLLGRAAMRGRNKPLEGAIKLTCIFVHSWPLRTSRKRKAMCNGMFKDTRADIDNQVKTVMDGLNGIAWKDDGQVAVLYAEKVCMDIAPCTQVTIEPLWEVNGVEVFS